MGFYFFGCFRGFISIRKQLTRGSGSGGVVSNFAMELAASCHPTCECLQMYSPKERLSHHQISVNWRSVDILVRN